HGKVVKRKLRFEFRSVALLLPVRGALTALRRRMQPMAEKQRLLGVNEIVAGESHVASPLLDVQAHELMTLRQAREELRFALASSLVAAVELRRRAKLPT